jgi:hypothetical protein
MGQGYELFKKDLEERSKGTFKVDIYDSSKYGNFDAVIQGLQMGVLQMESDAYNNLSVFNPKLTHWENRFERLTIQPKLRRFIAWLALPPRSKGITFVACL